MTKAIAIIILFSCLALGTLAVEIDYFRLGPSHMVRTTESNYAILTPTLFPGKWVIAQRNLNSFVFYNLQYIRTEREFRALTLEERALLMNANAAFQAVSTTDAPGENMMKGHFSNSVSQILPKAWNQRAFTSRSIAIDEIGDIFLSVYMNLLGEGVNRVFFIEAVAVLVYENGEVVIEPRYRLGPHAEFLQRVMQDVERAKSEFLRLEEKMNRINSQLAELASAENTESAARQRSELLEKLHMYENQKEEFMDQLSLGIDHYLQ